ncbi:hypothetical protein JJJ17_06845 [Paracoccus caeni]|uniref:Uncharacterized protein n=1 Tax=Paracoccus caeni TaxID=657651 RepID=A0A934SCZ7_9RHOB|nr:hypothetical protein [Paracoccus caeni]MBK4215637.1 hypothetical protein [Paracoccus caeni]
MIIEQSCQKQLFDDLEIIGDDPNSKDLQSNDSGSTNVSDEPVLESSKNACVKIWELVKEQVRNEKIPQFMRLGILAPLPIAFGIALSALTAIFGLDVRREDSSWPIWSLRRPPFVHLVTMSLIPAMQMVLGLVAADFLLFWASSGFRLTQNEVAFHFDSKWVFYLLNLPIGFIISVAVLSLSDQHKEHSLPVMILLGLLFAVVTLASYYIVVVISYPDSFLRPRPAGVAIDFKTRETLIYGSLSFFFLIFYAIWLEITEDITPKKKEN